MGEYYADILVDNRVVVEIKAIKKLAPEHEAQLLNYLKTTRIEDWLYVQFWPGPCNQT